MDRFNKLITNGNARSPGVESYKTLRTNIQYAGFDRELKSILITSCAPSEGKSLTAANLAVSMAQDGKKILLVDCDLRKPMQRRVFNVMNIQGLTNILAEGTDYREVVNDVNVDNLSLITSGPKPPNPSEILGSSKMKAFIDQVTEDFDMVILDTPPMLPVTDASVLSRMVDGMLLVIRHGKTSIEAVETVKSQVEKVGANLLGAVINDVPIDDSSYYYYEYYGEPEALSRKNRREFNV